jgi:polyhydroxyalkanoate synthesis regulator protein
MSTQSYIEEYRGFREAVLGFQGRLGDRTPFPELQSSWRRVQEIFQEQLLALPDGELEPEMAAKVQSFQTEINKQLRLLSTDMPFLQAARQAETVARRREQMGDRIQLLLRYCDAVLELFEGN